MMRYMPLWLGAVLVGLWVGIPSDIKRRPVGSEPLELASSGEGIRASFGLCHTGGGYNCVVDGDTIWLQGQNIRIAGIDAPETHDFKCPAEKAQGDEATRRLQELLNSGSISLMSIDRDRDGYGRLLRNVAVNGSDVGDTLVNEGLVRNYRGGKQPWC
ncbi:MAG TPA: thermonuclease family protein [Sphingomicrobium sp.]|nr:thermonuclease family protein [Sphingomicrobium sp.]